MVLRLILVGLVAGLGSNIPTRRDLQTMAHSAQHWMNARLAEWDDQAMPDDGASVFVIEPAETAPALATPSPVSDELFADVLSETVALFAQDELAGKTREMDQIVKSRDEIALSDPSKSLAIDLPTAPSPVASDEPMITDLAFDATIDETVQDMTVDVVALESTDGRDLAFEAVLEDVVSSFALDASTLAKADQAPRHEPLEVDENLYAGEAYALNRISDGIQEPIRTTDQTARSENRLTNAVRLTREAVIAWASLLHGPAVVSISP
jgi:hypothetical protein